MCLTVWAFVPRTSSHGNGTGIRNTYGGGAGPAEDIFPAASVPGTGTAPSMPCARSTSQSIKSGSATFAAPAAVANAARGAGEEAAPPRASEGAGKTCALRSGSVASASTERERLLLAAWRNGPGSEWLESERERRETALWGPTAGRVPAAPPDVEPRKGAPGASGGPVSSPGPGLASTSPQDRRARPRPVRTKNRQAQRHPIGPGCDSMSSQVRRASPLPVGT